MIPPARRPLSLVAALAGLLLASLPGPAPAASDRPSYNRDIRPILAENCFSCHGPDKSARKGDLRLDIREEAVKAGALLPGKPGESPLLARIFTPDARKLMPPAKSHKKLSAAQKAILKRWVEQGAEYQPHWAYLPPTRGTLPALRNPSWARNPIDVFVLAELEKRGLTPAPEADRPTLARRVSLDLRGLPPTPEEVAAFVKDSRPDAYERFVDRMMASPHWGEHRGRYWLDAARYADTHGIHFDNMREMWSYRDWVINAFNANQTFDRFTIEQIAGDLLPDRTVDQQVASGFNRCNITTNEGGAIAEEYLVLYTRDRTETVAQVWMGMTAGCAVCHDHKLDPVTQREFYQMAAFFNNTTQGAMDGNIKDTPPTITVPRMEDRPRWITLMTMLGEARRQADTRKANARGAFGNWLATAKPEVFAGKLPTEGLQLLAGLSEGKGSKLAYTLEGKPGSLDLQRSTLWVPGHFSDKAYRVQPGQTVTIPGAGDFDRDQPFTVAAWVKIPPGNVSGAILARMEEANDHRGWDLWLEGGRVGTHILNRWPTDAVKVMSMARLKPGTWQHVLVSYNGSGKAAGVKIYIDGVHQTAVNIQSDTLKSTTRTRVPLKIGQRNDSARLDNVALQDLRLYTRVLPDSEVSRLGRSVRLTKLLARGKKMTPAESNELYDWWLSVEDEQYPKLLAAVETLKREDDAIRARGTIAHVSAEKPAKPMAHILYRGDYDKRRDPVEAGTPKVLPALPAKLSRNRLGFAQWLVQPEHPLTARVTVNRFWQEVFGVGLVRTSGDFGIAGDLPSHPELLDWLALEFQQDWDVKRFFRLLVTSATYRQAAITTDLKREKDASNTYLSRGPRFRMDGEMIRDYALAASGLLVQRFGGPSVKPYQPDGVWEAVAMIGSNTRDYRRDSGENLYRRSTYTFWKRSAPPAAMDIFNAPSREVCVVRRERTNTPLMALVTLNDVQFVEAARVLAERALKEGGKKTEDRIDYLARKLLARSFRPAEQKVVQGMLSDLVTAYADKPDEAKKLIAFGESKADPDLDAKALASWTMLVNALLNLDEVLNK